MDGYKQLSGKRCSAAYELLEAKSCNDEVPDSPMLEGEFRLEASGLEAGIETRRLHESHSSRTCRMLALGALAALLLLAAVAAAALAVTSSTTLLYGQHSQQPEQLTQQPKQAAAVTTSAPPTSSDATHAGVCGANGLWYWSADLAAWAEVAAQPASSCPRGPSVELLDSGACANQQLDPVCDAFGRVYPNSCLARAVGSEPVTKALRGGGCSSVSPSRCTSATFGRASVCDSTGRRKFENGCFAYLCGVVNTVSSRSCRAGAQQHFRGCQFSAQYRIATSVL